MKLSNIATTESLASIPSRRCIAGISEDLSAHGLCFDCLHHADEADQTYGSDEDLPIYSTVLQAQTGPELAELCMHNHSADRLCPMTLFYP